MYYNMNFIDFVFPNFRRWSSTITNLDLKFGFYVKFPPRTGSKGLESEILVPKHGFPYFLEFALFLHLPF